MKVELKQIIDELTDAINLPKGYKVSAIVDIDKIIGWTIVEVHEDGSINPISDKKFNNIKELISEYKGNLVNYYEDKLDRCACDYFNKGYKKALEKQGEHNVKFMEEQPANQKRKLDIVKAAVSATGIIEQEEWFIKGAEWSDKNPSCISSENQSKQKEYTFKSLPRLLEMIEPSSRAKAYCQKLIDTLIEEGYSTDAKIVGECLKQMNGEDVPMAVMDENKGEQKTPNMDRIKEKAHQIAWESSKRYDPTLSKESWCEMAALEMAYWLHN